MAIIDIHYDCDPGQDDAIALLYALGSPNINVQSISVVGGNADATQCTINALQILALAGRSDIPVYTGAARPLKRILKTLPEVFGITGMAGAEDLPIPTQTPLMLDWVKTDLRHIIKTRTLVATGPLTNLARDIQKNPDFAAGIDHLYIMGGCPVPEPLHGQMGNYKAPGTDDYAEYNFAVDPEATKIVFQAGFKAITLVGLNVTRAMLYGHAIDTRMRAIGTRIATRAANILASVGEDDVVDYGHLRTTPTDPVRAIHDVVAMAALDRPDLFDFEMVPLRIIDGPLPAAGGQTLIDAENYDHPSVRIARSIDNNAFMDVMINNIAALKH